MTARRPAPDVPCAICGLVPARWQPNRLRAGRCSACYSYWWRHGHQAERPTEARRVCSVCGARHWAHGYCRYHYYWRSPGVRERVQAGRRAYDARQRAARRERSA